MNSIQKAWIAIGVFVVLAMGLLFWQSKYNKPKDVITELSKQDVELLIKDFPPAQLKQFAESKEERGKILQQLKEILALAAEARAMGVAKKPEVKSQLDLQRTIALAQAYMRKNSTDASAEIKKEDIDAYLKKTGVEAKFKSFVKEMQDAGQMPQSEMQEAQMAQLKEQWARVYIGEERALKAGMDKEREVQLQIAIQQALILMRKYNEESAEKNKDLFVASDADIEKWLLEHPELDTKGKRAKAEEILNRARSGEDFAKLANENTDDPGNKDPQTGELKGGFYEFGRGRMDKNFEEASFALKPGEISDLVETPYGYHIIKLEAKEMKKGEDGKEQEMVKVRHILISTMVKDPSSPRGGELPLKEKARQEVERGKRDEYINKIAAKHNVVLPADFDVVVPEMPPQQPQQGAPVGPQVEDEESTPPPVQKKEEEKKKTEKNKPKTEKKGK